MPAPQPLPMTYMVNGKQYIVVACQRWNVSGAVHRLHVARRKRRPATGVAHRLGRHFIPMLRPDRGGPLRQELRFVPWHFGHSGETAPGLVGSRLPWQLERAERWLPSRSRSHHHAPRLSRTVSRETVTTCGSLFRSNRFPAGGAEMDSGREGPVRSTRASQDVPNPLIARSRLSKTSPGRDDGVTEAFRPGIHLRAARRKAVGAEQESRNVG